MKRDTIKNHNDFLAGPNDPTARCAYFLVRKKPAKYPDDARYGMIVTKKTFKHAVDRNRAKRMFFKLPADMLAPGELHKISVYAIESFGKISAPLTIERVVPFSWRFREIDPKAMPQE